MRQLSSFPIACMLSLGMLGVSGCQKHAATSASAQPATGSTAPRETSPAATRPPPADRAIAYRCADGSSLSVLYRADDAELRWAGDSRVVTLPRAQSASRGGGDVYVGATMSLQRDGNAMQLHADNASPLTCGPADAG